MPVNGLLSARYSSDNLDRYLLQYLGGTRLHETLTDVLIPAYETQSAMPWFFKTRYAAAHRSLQDDPLLAQVVRATVAAPSYFPPAMIGELCFIDGGVFANNPAVCAYAEARRLYPGERDFTVVSLGTGRRPGSLSCNKIKNWGAVQWAIPLLGVLSDSASATVNYQMNTFVDVRHYFRFNPMLDADSTDMDNASKENIKRLETIAQKEIHKNAGRLDEVSRLLLLR